jgi:hypothetical protein
MRRYAGVIVITGLLGCGASSAGSTDASVADRGGKDAQDGGVYWNPATGGQ